MDKIFIYITTPHATSTNSPLKKKHKKTPKKQLRNEKRRTLSDSWLSPTSGAGGGIH